ncbi:MAG: zf-HC2 domain-containing protein [Actinomycetota bacterium]|nr:zf-HC2 domain-containing protein [Actinomycetota bacterium]
MSGHPCLERLLMPEALSGRLEPAEEKRVMAHLETCPACQEVAADIEISLISLALLKEETTETVDLRDTAPLHHLVPPAPAQLAVLAPLTAPDAGAPSPVPALTIADGELARSVRPVRRLLGPVRGPVRLLAVAASAAVLLLGGGVLIGREVLPPRDALHYGPAVALTPPASAVNQTARGTVAVAEEGTAIAVRLNATSLPSVGWYECVWVAQGQSRSAGSFRVTNGTAKNVDLRVAQPQDSLDWDLQIVQHQGTTSQVVLEGSTTTYG